MKVSRIILIILGIVIIVALTAGITIWVQKTLHLKRLEKRMPHLAGLLGKEKPRDLLETIKTVRAIDVLGLAEEQIAKFIYNNNRLKELKKEHHKMRQEKLDAIDKLLKEKASTEELQNSINEFRKINEEYQNNCKTVRDDINSILTPEQQARLILFERDFQQQMQRFLQKGPCRIKREKRSLKGKERSI